MKLWLDDLRDPSGWKPGEDWEWAETADQAINLISRGKVKEISFDHDLGDDIHGSGYTVAFYIEEQAFFGRIGRIKWSVHSANPVGRKRIEAAMQNADKYWTEQEIRNKDVSWED